MSAPSIGHFDVRIEISWFDRMWENVWGADQSGDLSWLNDGPLAGSRNITDVQLLAIQAENVLGDAENNCAKALSRASLLDQVQNKLKNLNIVNVSQNTDVLASEYMSDAQKGETLKNYFSRYAGSNQLATFARSSTTAILSLNGAESFSASVKGIGFAEISIGFFIHELTHHATGQTDLQLATRLGIANNGSESDASDKLSAYFNAGC